MKKEEIRGLVKSLQKRNSGVWQYVKKDTTPAISSGEGKIGDIQVAAGENDPIACTAVIMRGGVLELVDADGKFMWARLEGQDGAPGCIYRHENQEGSSVEKVIQEGPITLSARKKLLIVKNNVARTGGWKAGVMYADVDPEDESQLLVGFSAWNWKMDAYSLARAKKIAIERALTWADMSSEELEAKIEEYYSDGYYATDDETGMTFFKSDSDYPIPFSVEAVLPDFLERVDTYYNNPKKGDLPERKLPPWTDFFLVSNEDAESEPAQETG